jgi:ABC-2 type transport system ATP-binding protein
MEVAKSAGIEIKSVNLRKPSLEDVFLHFTGRRIRE